MAPGREPHDRGACFGVLALPEPAPAAGRVAHGARLRDGQELGGTHPLTSRYGAHDLSVFTPAERERFGHELTEEVAWELLYRIEPDLYERLIAGERLHPAIIDWLPVHVRRAVELGAGTGRLTVHLAPRCDELVAVEPAAPLRERLRAKLPPTVEVRDGFFDELPVPDGWADLVASCSAFRPDHGEDALHEIERVCAPGGIVVFVRPNTPQWLAERGYEYVSFPGELEVEFESREDAIEQARIFYPDAVDRIDSAVVPYDVLGINPPRDLCWKRT